MTDNSDLIPYLERLASARVLCIGDVMLDHYIYGQVERVSPEAPIPVLRIERELKTLGRRRERAAQPFGARRLGVVRLGDRQ